MMTYTSRMVARLARIRTAAYVAELYHRNNKESTAVSHTTMLNLLGMRKRGSRYYAAVRAVAVILAEQYGIALRNEVGDGYVALKHGSEHELIEDRAKDIVARAASALDRVRSIRTDDLDAIASTRIEEGKEELMTVVRVLG